MSDAHPLNENLIVTVLKEKKNGVVTAQVCVGFVTFGWHYMMFWLIKSQLTAFQVCFVIFPDNKANHVYMDSEHFLCPRIEWSGAYCFRSICVCKPLTWPVPFYHSVQRYSVSFVVVVVIVFPEVSGQVSSTFNYHWCCGLDTLTIWPWITFQELCCFINVNAFLCCIM